MAFWDDWQKNKNPIAWSEGFQHGYKKIPKSSTPSSEELSLAKANKKLVGKEKLDESMQNTVQKVVKNMIKEGNTSGRFDKNKPRDLVKFNQKFIDKPSNKTSLNNVSSTADSNSYTITSQIKRPFPGREYAHKTIHDDGTVTISYGPTPDPKDATDFIGKRSATKPESKPKVEPKAKPTIGSAVKGATSFVTPIVTPSGNTIDMEEFSRMLDEASDAEEFSRMLADHDKKASTAKPESKPEPKVKPTIDLAVKEATKPTDGSEAFIKGVARSAKKISNKDIDPTAEGSLHKMAFKGLPNEAPRVNKDAIRLRYYPFEQDAERDFKRLRKPSFNKLDSNNNNSSNPRVPQDPNAYYKQLRSLVKGGINGVIANLGTLGSMPLPGDPKENRDRLRVENHPEDLSSVDTVVPMNPQGTVYLDPKLGIQNTEVVEDYEGGRYYRNAQTGQFEPLDYNPRYKYYSPLPRVKKVYPTDSNGVPYLNDILGGVLSMPMSTTPLPIPPMVPPVSADEGEIPSGTVEVGPDTEKPIQPVQPIQPAQSMAKPLRRAPKPKPYVEPVVNNTSVQTPTSNVSAPVAAPTLSSVTSQAVRHNGGFDDYRRQSVLSALRAAGGISPAEAVQRGIIPWEALNYV